MMSVWHRLPYVVTANMVRRGFHELGSVKKRAANEKTVGFQGGEFYGE